LNVNQKHWVIYRLGVQSPFFVKDRGALPKGFFVIASSSFLQEGLLAMTPGFRLGDSGS
jgi:hypothetical protein